MLGILRVDIQVGQLVVFTPQPLRAAGVMFSPMGRGGGGEFVRAVSQKL